MKASRMTFLNGSYNVFESFLWRNINFLVDTVSLVFAGDINFSDPVRSDVKQQLYTYNDTLRRVALYTREADIAFGNLESPFVPAEALSNKNSGAKLIYLNAEKNSASALRFEFAFLSK